MDILCPCCESKKTDCILTNYYNYDLVSCQDCQCVFCYPFKAPGVDFYSEADDWESIRRHSIISKWHKSHPTWKSNNLLDGNGKVLLDIGCGNGDFAEFASMRNFSTIGIDIDKASLKIADRRQLVNAQFVNTTLLDFAKTNKQKFDIISMFEVFEHLDNPKETLEIICSLLKPGGLFIGSLPNENRFLSKKLNLSFALPPYHLTYWTKDSWTNYLQMNQFEKIYCENTAYYGYVSDLLYYKFIERFKKIGTNKILSTFAKAFFVFPKKMEMLIEKGVGKSSSFYFEFKNMG